MEYYLLINCVNCGADIFYGPCLTTMYHENKPVLNVGEGSEQSYICDNCNQETYVGELEILSEDEA
jgi:hypothetical protein